MSETDGATPNERLLAAARTDNEELLLELFEEGGFDINTTDGLGNTALHLAAREGSVDVIEHILSHDECDVDPVNHLEGATPLHLAVKIEDPDVRKYIAEQLLDAGADTMIRDKNGDTVADLLRPDDEIFQLIRKARAQASVAKSDIADDDEDDGDESGSGSESE